MNAGPTFTDLDLVLIQCMAIDKDRQYVRRSFLSCDDFVHDVVYNPTWTDFEISL